MLKTPSLIFFAGLFVACGGVKSEFADACEDNSDMTSESCECLADIAEKELPEKGVEILTAMINDDGDQMKELRADMDTGEFFELGAFMMMAPLKCSINFDDWSTDG